ncbi:MAG TPA: Trp family transcriptional regulator [Patescibacteria group bacterium]|nr:Trp family transcriptional regulator [Patescibacteria group bacterium]
MTQISRRHLDAKTQKRIYEIFTDVIADVKTPSEVQALLEDFFTPTERVMLPKRLCIAFLLLKGYDHRTIASYLKVSFTTINRVSTSLKVGGKGYTLVLTRLRKRKQFESVLTQIENGIVSMLASIGGPSRLWKTVQNTQHNSKYID